MEQGFAEAKGEVGLDPYEGRRWMGWYRHSTVARWASALVTVLRAAHLPEGALAKKMAWGTTRSTLTAFRPGAGLRAAACQ